MTVRGIGFFRYDWMVDCDHPRRVRLSVPSRAAHRAVALKGGLQRLFAWGVIDTPLTVVRAPRADQPAAAAAVTP